MEITEVRVFLKEGANRKLKAFTTVTLDNAFVVRDVKVIEGNKGLFVAMPSRKEREPCPKCGYRNVVRSKFCNQCGGDLSSIQRSPITDEAARQAEHRDVAHPITMECREYIQKKVLEAYEAEKARQAPSQAPTVAPPPPEGGPPESGPPEGGPPEVEPEGEFKIGEEGFDTGEEFGLS